MLSIGSLSSSIRKKFVDTFSSRSNTSGGLGVASDGSNWTPINGTIQVSSGAATATSTPTIITTTRQSGGLNGSNTVVVANATGIAVGQRVTGTGIALDAYVTAINGTTITLSANNTRSVTGTLYFLSASSSDYPISIQGMPTANNIIELKSINQGAGAAIWVQSSADWWAVGVDSIYNTIPGNSGSFTNPGTFTPGNPYTVFVPPNIVFTAYNPGTYTPGNTTYYTNPTTYQYYENVRILKSVSSVVSTIASSAVSTSSAIRSLRVTLNGTQITARAFSDTNLTTQLGSDLVYNATGAAITTQYGICVTPSAYQQSAIISTSATITRN